MQIEFPVSMVSTVKVRALIAKRWDTESWNEDKWEDPERDGDVESLNSGETFRAVEADFPLASEGINPALEIVMASPKQLLCKTVLFLLRTHSHPSLCF